MVTVSDLERVHGFEVERLRNVPVMVVLSDLGLLGVAWRDVARVVGVSLSTVAGWRSGVVSPSAAEWERLLGFAACVDVLSGPTCDSGGAVAWLESPVSDRVFVSGLNLLSVGRMDLVFELVAGADPVVVLDSLDPDWRVRGVDDGFASVVMVDGCLSIVAVDDAV